MLPTSYETLAAIALVLGGSIACFAGYRLFRIVLAIYGFIAGAMLASSMMGSSNAFGMVLAALIGGLIGSLVLFFAYFVGIALVGAGLGAFLVHVGWAQVSATDPPVAIIILFVALGTIAALVLQQYVIIVSTAFSGAWTVILGALTLTTTRAPLHGRSAPDVWVLYPFTPGGARRWVVLAWIVLGLFGTAVQIRMAGRKR
jgi:Domain of unknown function (DUF4203)